MDAAHDGAAGVRRRCSVALRSLSVAILGLTFAVLASLRAAEPDAAGALATVNGRAVTQADLEFLYLVRRVPEAMRAEVRERFISELIDQRLMADFLASRRTEATPEELDARVAAVRGIIERGGRNPDEVLGKLGVTDDMLRRTLALPLAWRQHVARVVTGEQLSDYFEQHRARFDGTRRRLSQIVLTLPPDVNDAARQAALEQLKTIRQEIEAGKTTFPEAAQAHSQSPSKAQGGDLGWGVYGTRFPREIADIAFDLPEAALSEPFLTRFGAHLVFVADEVRGDLSLEDVRSEVLAEIGRGLWNEQLAKQRAAAKIERPNAD